jgi:hypothetical protein
VVLMVLTGGFATEANAQFSSSLEGVVTDPTGAVVPEATVTLTNTDTGVSQVATTGSRGEYRFLSVAPGPYEVTASGKGFASHKVAIRLQTEQTLNVPFALSLSSQSQTVEVTDQAPVLDTAETRNQMTISTEELDSLPLPGRDQLGLVTLAPGVTGLGVIGPGGNGQSTDNYAAETQVTASANGRSSTGNMFVVDGLDITSNITPGVLNLVPNPDTIQEATVQVNTFNVEYGRSSSIVEVMTTRSGSSKYHFLASEYYSANWLTARTEFQPRETFTMLPFHSSNISASAGGPVPWLKQTYFFTGWEPLLSLTQANSQITVEDPAFTTWAQQNWPNSIGVKLLAQYPSVNVSRTGVSRRACRCWAPLLAGLRPGPIFRARCRLWIPGCSTRPITAMRCSTTCAWTSTSARTACTRTTTGPACRPAARRCAWITVRRSSTWCGRSRPTRRIPSTAGC